MGEGLEVRQEKVALQAHFVRPDFGLLRDAPHLGQHLFESLESYGIRLADFKMDSTDGSFGEVSLQIALRTLGTTHLFLDRVDLVAAPPPFLSDFTDGAFVSDLLNSVKNYSPVISYRTFGVTHEIHGRLSDILPQEFLTRFSASAPKGFGPLFGSGTVFYFGAGDKQLTGSLALDFSGLVEEGVFLKAFTLFDASQVELPHLVRTARTQLFVLAEEIGLDLIGVA